MFLATVDRDRLQAVLQHAEAVGLALDDETLDWARSAGVAGERITTTVDVSGYVDAKRTPWPPTRPVPARNGRS